MCRAGSETLSRGPPRKNIAQGRWTFGKGLPELLTLPLPPQALDFCLDPTLLKTRKAERERERWKVYPPHFRPDPTSQRKPGRWREPWSTSWKESELSGAWAREDGTHIDSVASGGIWGPQGAGAPHEIHAAFKVSVWGEIREQRISQPG